MSLRCRDIALYIVCGTVVSQFKVSVSKISHIAKIQCFQHGSQFDNLYLAVWAAEYGTRANLDICTFRKVKCGQPAAIFKSRV